MRFLRLAGDLLVRSFRNPPLVPALLAVAWRFRRRDWHRRAPFLPLPDPLYLSWRMYTAYGDPRALPPARDIERYALWAWQTR